MANIRPILLGIVGDSGTGKTTFTKGIEDVLGPGRVTNICVDDYHRYNRKQRAEKSISALHPDCNYIDIMEQHIHSLRRGEAILKPIYNHSSGDFDPPEYIEPKEFVIIEGLLGFYTRKLRNAFDVKVYLDPEEQLRTAWKIARDTKKRGYSPDQVRESLKKREQISQRFIRPQRNFADVVVHFHWPENITGKADSQLNANLILRPSIKHPDFSYLLKNKITTDQYSISVHLDRDDGQPVDILDIKVDIAKQTAHKVMKIIWDHLPGIAMPQNYIGKYHDGEQERISNPLAITQLLTSYHLKNFHIDQIEQRKKGVAA